jgi:hypothetical protein
MDPFAAVNLDQQSQPNQDGMSFWFKWLIKGSAVILGFIGIILGIVTTLSFSFTCMLGGIILT